MEDLKDLGLPNEMEHYILTNNISGYMYEDDVKQHASRVGFSFGFMKGKNYMLTKILSYIKDKGLNKEDFKEMFDHLLHNQ